MSIFICEKPTQEPKATENIELMIKMISDLISKGFAYQKNKHVYFEVKKFEDYGKLSNKELDEVSAGSRVEISENKKSPEDFVLGNLLIMMNLIGHHHGEMEDRVGI